MEQAKVQWEGINLQVSRVMAGPSLNPYGSSKGYSAVAFGSSIWLDD